MNVLAADEVIPSIPPRGIDRVLIKHIYSN